MRLNHAGIGWVNATTLYNKMNKSQSKTRPVSMLNAKIQKCKVKRSNYLMNCIKKECNYPFSGYW
jgi:hypothetical protein